MTNEELEKIRKKFKELQEKRTAILKLGEEIKLLEQNPTVKKYLELVNLYEKNTTGRMYEFDKKTDDDLLYSSLCSVRINETNNIYVYMGTFQKNYECDIEHGSTDYRVNKYDPDVDYRIYRNLELMSYQDAYEIEVQIEDCEKFEQEHIVIYPQNTSLCDQYYLKLKDEFFETSVYESQEKALEKVLNLKNK